VTSNLYSLIVPIYKSEGSIPRLLKVLLQLQAELAYKLEIIFVVDGSPDASSQLLRQSANEGVLRGTLIELTRNFGSFAAIRVGMNHARGSMMAVMAADLQEPPELVLKMFQSLAYGEVDLVFGQRVGRDDPLSTRLLSSMFWGLYRRLILPDIPKGGIDIFACTAQVRDDLMRLNEANSSLVSQLMWLGYRRVFIPYERQKRQEGNSAWTIAKRLRYMSDSILSFSDLPIRVFLWLSCFGFIFGSSAATTIAILRLFGVITVPGYAALAILILCCCMLNNLVVAIVGLYTWRAFDNTKNRPLALIRSKLNFTISQPS